MLKLLLAHQSPAGAGARLSILILHRVLPRIDPLFPGEPDGERFDQLCRWLKSWFNVLPLDEAARRLREGGLPERALAISFDDGYADNHDVALPILQRHGLSATFFVACSFLDGGRMWNDTVIEALRHTAKDRLDLSDIAPGGTPLGVFDLGGGAGRGAALTAIIGRVKYLPHAERVAVAQRIADVAGAPLPDGLMMDSAQVRALHRAGMQIGAHTMTHPILGALDDTAARQEIRDSRRFLEDLLDAPCTLFAYPNGRPGTDFSMRSVALVRDEGFDAAVTTQWGAANRETDPLQLPRFTPWDRSRLRFGARMLQNLWQTRR